MTTYERSSNIDYNYQFLANSKNIHTEKCSLFSYFYIEEIEKSVNKMLHLKKM